MCEGECVNTAGSFSCHCDGRKGLRLAEDGRQCKKIPECLDLYEYKHEEMLYLGEQFSGLPVIYLRFRLQADTRYEECWERSCKLDLLKWTSVVF